MSEGVGSHFKESNTTFFIAYERVCMRIFFTVIILIAIELCIPMHICTYVCMYLYFINKDLSTGHGCIFIHLSNIADKILMGVNYVYIRMYYLFL